MNNLCIIPARGGSKRIPRKNIKDFLGKPIIAYAIEAALKSDLFEDIMVSTDDEEIAEMSQKWGASIPFMRSQKTSNDFATTYDVLEEVLLKYQESQKIFDNLLCLYPCTPLVKSSKIIESYNKLLSYDCSTILTIMPFNFPIQRALKKSGIAVSYFYPEFENSRSQDLEKSYHDAGQFYWMKIDSLLAEKKILMKKTGYLALSEMEAQDVDTMMDWELLKLKYQLK